MTKKIEKEEDYYDWLLLKLLKHKTNPKTTLTGTQMHTGWGHIENTIGIDKLDDFIVNRLDIIRDFWNWKTGNCKTLDDKAVWIKQALEFELEESWICGKCGKPFDCSTPEKAQKIHDIILNYEDKCDFCRKKKKCQEFEIKEMINRTDLYLETPEEEKERG